MEPPAYEGGTGGKFRRQPLRRPTPYDRPPTAARGIRGLATDSGSGSGWISKLVDPASRFITGSASRIFSSVFRKRLTGLPKAEGPEQNFQARPHVPEPVDAPPSESQAQVAVAGNNPTMDFEIHGISEIEQLLKQNKYTRAQADYLTGLISSRAIEPTGRESENYNEKIHVSDEGIGVRNPGLIRNLSTSESPSFIPQDVAASPAEIAKAYMSSRLPKASSSAISLPSQGFREDKSFAFSALSSTKQQGLSVIRQPALRISEPRGPLGVGYPTSKPHGRSALYRMSRSPYFQPSPMVNVMGTPGSTSKSDGKQGLKRSSSILDSEHGSFGPIRRIRQKSNLISAANARFDSSSGSRGFPLLQLDNEDLKDPTSSQQPRSLNQLKNSASGLHIDGNRDNKTFSSNVSLVPSHSIETSRKILEHIDKVSPPEKKPTMKVRSMDESPSKLTADMLNGRALKSMEDVDASQFVGMDVIGTSDIINGEDPQKITGSQSEQFGKSQENSPTNPNVPVVKFEDIINTIPAKVISLRKPAFQMTVTEDDEQDALDVSLQSTVNRVTTDASTSGMPSISIPFTKIGNAYDESHDHEKESSFRFPVATNPGGLPSPALTPTMPSQSRDNLPSRSEQTVVPSFMFGSRKSGTANSSSVTDVGNESLTESKPDQSPDRKIQMESSNLFSGVKREAGPLKFRSGISESGSGSAETIAFGPSVTSTQSNGAVHSSSLSSSFAASTPDTLPQSTVSLFSSKSNSAADGSSSLPIPSTLPAFSSAITYNFGAASTTAPVSVSLSSDKPNSEDTEGKFSKKSPFRSFNLPTNQAAPSFLSSGNSNASLMGSTAFPVSGNTTSFEANSTSVVPIFSGGSNSGSDFGLFGSSSSAQTNSTSVSVVNSSPQKSSSIFGSTGGSLFGGLPAQSGSANSLSSQSSISSSATLGLSSSSLPPFGSSSSSSPGFGLVPFGSTNPSAKPFGSTSGFSPNSAPPTSTNSGFSFSSGTGVFSTSPAFLSSVSNASNSTSGLSFSTGSTMLNSGFSFSASATSSGSAGNTFSPAATSSSTISSSLFGSSPSTGFSFGLKSTAAGVSPFGFGSSSGPAFSFNSSSAAMSAPAAAPVYGGFSSPSQNNDQMSVEDTMADDTNQSPSSSVTFGQPNSTPFTNFVFGSTAPSSGTSPFQFNSQQNPPTLQNPNPFQAGGNPEFAPGGSFSLGSGGGDKTPRKFVKVRRDKMRRKQG